jgi:hypothetical protein
MGFKPDLIWWKRRDYAASHVMVNSVTGVKGALSSDLTLAEYTEASGQGLTSFDTDGFTVGAGGYYTGYNANNSATVAWNWKAGGAAVSNTNGSITSSVSANVDAGFSVVSYTGNATNATIGHGLASAPELLIVKSRDTIKDWMVHHDSFNGTKFIRLNLPNATNTDGLWQNTAPTDSVFYVNSGTTEVNSPSGTKYIAYCFHSVDGYSKVGSYTGNTSANNFIYTGFRPKFLLLKGSSQTGVNWLIMDSARNTYNVMGDGLYPNSSSAEASPWSMDFVSNGVNLKCSGCSSMNNSGSTYIYLAFAEMPFKWTNAR